ncbi:hypothetical protein D3C71_1983410 [compost metagenome]
MGFLKATQAEESKWVVIPLLSRTRPWLSLMTCTPVLKAMTPFGVSDATARPFVQLTPSGCTATHS